ncbi:heparinase II/III family protein [Antarctobacter heliothermus]|uniref:heparinase II/III family protein n=1 Tax=Antarctobacter heliothermus TaxID=74033 RepID=UPI001FE2FB63|nr:heparinase II/III family protein [Antarctobacter heliothermus]
MQVYGRLWFRLSRPRPDLSPAPSLRPISGPWQPPACRAPALTGPGAFRLLNEDGTLAAHGWDDPAKAKLWRYNQHYFDDLNAVSAVKRGAWHTALIDDWIAANPPGRGTGWEPYPTSLRIVNWVKWGLAGNSLDDTARRSLAIQTRWLMRRLEWHLLGNHLFANAKALVFAGLHYDGREAARWLAKGTEILAREIPEQILRDGGQFELSPMYHALAVEDLLDLVNIARAFGREDLAEAWGAHVPSMLRWLVTMTQPDGDLAFFNDTAIGIAPTTDQLLAYAEKLGFPAPPPLPDLLHLPDSGYVRLKRGLVVLIADLARIGPDYLPGHAHADTLSFELSLHGRRVIVNSGTSVYGLGPERLRQRSTAAHSTVVIGGRDSSEVWSGFRVGRRARPFDIDLRDEGGVLIATGAHDGYRHLPGSPVHRRTWELGDDALILQDRIEGRGEHLVEVIFHLAPGLVPVQLDQSEVEIRTQADAVLAVLSVRNGAVDVVPSSWHPEFGRSMSAYATHIKAQSALPITVETMLRWKE